MAVDSAPIPWDELRGRRVVVGLSGGVDSSVSAALLKRHGLEVTALFMKNWEEDDTPSHCAAAEDREDAQQVCDLLGIRLETINFAAEYWDQVFERFLSEYGRGRTPNPDILCNSEIKFRAFLDYATSALGADLIATGHYCRRTYGEGPTRLLRGVDPGKDQSYFLHAISGAALSRTIFPIGGMLKREEVRPLAEELRLPTAQKRDSTGICFIGERHFKEFLGRYLPQKRGPIVDTAGHQVGEHDGLAFLTIGQRHGLSIGGRQDGDGRPWYVVGKDLEKNTLIVAQGSDHEALLSKALIASNPAFIAGQPPLPLHCTCKIRYRQADVGCTIHDLGNQALGVAFDGPVAAVAPGQSVVFYLGEECLGGAVIEQALKEQTWQT
ncbi:MAG: tRNA 2-thiouridine(34) synthase MnmA [Succinivibrionaceae bacterium]|nr:tRNA 2-thiouridine(34) synthase MnmA [Succinivibrionaceae bacterium]